MGLSKVNGPVWALTFTGKRPRTDAVIAGVDIPEWAMAFLGWTVQGGFGYLWCVYPHVGANIARADVGRCSGVDSVSAGADILGGILIPPCHNGKPA